MPEHRSAHYGFVRIGFVSECICTMRNVALHHHEMLTRNLLRMLFRHECGGVSIVLQIPAMMPDLFEREK
jgi:hypothetical protein